MQNHIFTLIIAQVIVLSTITNLFSDDSKIFKYLSPRPGANYVSPKTQLNFRLNDQSQNKIDISQLDIRVTGEQGGEYPGRLYLARDKETIIFKPDIPFSDYDKIEVKISLEHSGRSNEFNYHFNTSTLEENPPDKYQEFLETIDRSVINDPPEIMGEMTVINNVAVPADFPMINVDILQQTGPGNIFVANMTGTPYMTIYKNDGTPYYYRRLPDAYIDFNMHPTGTLSVCDGARYFELDHGFNFIDTLQAGNGYGTDFRELQLLENGNYLVIALDYQRVDMSRLISGGNPNANVLGTHAQELDRDGNVVFEFRTWDHYNILDAIDVNLLAGTIDYVHMNAIAVDYDGHLLTSSRHLCEVTKINRQTGEIIWRLGGNNNQFEYVDDIYGITYQHDIRPVPGQPNHYTIFDNGNLHSPRFSRAIEYAIDTTAMTATKVWEYRHTPDRFTAAMGNAQRLANGNTVINWASNNLPKITEVTPSGEIVYEMDFEEGFSAYRTYRHSWDGVADVPYLIVEPYTERVALIFNKFGDEEVDYYRIYADQSPNPTTVIDSSYNTWINLRQLENNQRYYFRVTAVSLSGEESDFSNEENAMVNYVFPGENLILNGDFSQGGLNWDLIVNGGAQASGSVENGEYRVQITTSVIDPGLVSLRQTDIELLEDRHYRLEFDGYADNTRSAEVRLQMDSPPNTDYSRIGAFILNSTPEHYTFDFTMEETSDLASRLAFDVGNSTDDVYLDNISLIQIVSAPQLTAKIPDLLYREDSGVQMVVGDLGTIFNDSDQTDPLVVTTHSDNQQIDAFVEDYSLFISSETNYYGHAQIIVTGTDITFLAVSDTFEVTITPVNDSPQFLSLPDTLLVNPDNPVTLQLWDYIEDPETEDPFLDYAFDNSDPDITSAFNVSTGELTVSVSESFAGEDLLTITVTDDSGAVSVDSILYQFDPDFSGIVTVGNKIPKEFDLMQNYPNPFNPNTIINYELPITNFVELSIFNLLGQKVVNLISEKQQAGYYQVEWDASGYSSGVYYYRLQAGDFVEVKKMILMR